MGNVTSFLFPDSIYDANFSLTAYDSNANPMAENYQALGHESWYATVSNTIPTTRDQSKVEDSPIFSIFPNPSNGMFSIQAEGARRSGFHYSLYDLKGKEMIQGQFRSNSMEIDATFLPKGLYLLQIKAQQAQIVKRILIQ